MTSTASMANIADPPALSYGGHLNISAAEVDVASMRSGAPQEHGEKEKDHETVILEANVEDEKSVTGDVGDNVEDDEEKTLLGTDVPFVSLPRYSQLCLISLLLPHLIIFLLFGHAARGSRCHPRTSSTHLPRHSRWLHTRWCHRSIKCLPRPKNRLDVRLGTLWLHFRLRHHQAPLSYPSRALWRGLLWTERERVCDECSNRSRIVGFAVCEWVSGDVSVRRHGE